VAHTPFLALALILLGLAVFVWRARPERIANQWFSAFTVFVACWVFGVGELQSGTHLNAWGRFTFASACLIPAAFFGFIHCYPTPAPWPPAFVRRMVLWLGLVLAALSLTTPLMVYDNTMTPAGLQRTTGPLYPLFSIYFLIAWLAAISIFLSKWKAARGLARAQLQYVGAGILISGAGGISTNLLAPIVTGKSTYSWIGPYFALVLITMVGHAIIRHRLMDLRLIINRGLAFGFMTAVASAIVIVLARTGLSTWNESFPSSRDISVVFIVTLAMMSTPVQALFRRWIDPYLHRGRIEYSSALREATRRLSRLMQPPEVAQEIREVLTRAFVPDFFFMAARRAQSEPLEPLAFEGPLPADLLTVAGLITDDTRPSATIVTPDDPSSAKAIAHETLRSAGIELVIQLARRNEWLGIILLGPRRSGDAYFKQDMEFIEALAELTSIALDNSLLYRQSLQTLEYSDRLLESLGSAVVAVDADGRITSHNPAAQAMLGLATNARGHLLSTLPSEVAWTLAFVVTDTWCPRELEVVIEHPKRGSLPVILSAAALHDHTHRITGALVVTTDLSTVKALERNQRRIEHFTMMARFYAGIAHEIRSPLAAISNFISMLPDRFDDPEYRDTAARILPHEVGRIVRLADRLRLMAPSEDGKLAPISLRPLLADIVAIHSPAAKDSAVTIVFDCAHDDPIVLGDPGQLVQLFVNLLRNAIEAMPSGGCVRLRCTESTNSGVVVEVIDEGTGIEPSVHAHIFQPFFTTKATGTGLGLSICKEISEFHRATLSLLNRGQGRGTTATVEFPAISVLEAASRSSVATTARAAAGSA
jgi:signal transduction histidine kinase